jgi:hypothetical protein
VQKAKQHLREYLKSCGFAGPFEIPHTFFRGKIKCAMYADSLKGILP